MMTSTKFDIEKFDRKNDFGLWLVRMKALLEQQRLVAALEELPSATIAAYDNVIQKKAYSALILCLGDRVLREITKETIAAGIWKKLKTLYMKKSLANHLYLKKKLYTFHMHPGKSQSEQIDKFQKLVGDLAAIDTAISDENEALLLLTFLPSSYDSFVETLLYGQDTLKLEDVLATLNSRELQKMTEAKGDGGEGLYVKGRSGHKDMKQGTDSAWSKSHGRSSRLSNVIIFVTVTNERGDVFVVQPGNYLKLVRLVPFFDVSFDESFAVLPAFREISLTPSIGTIASEVIGSALELLNRNSKIFKI
ncbi:hypothetical protein Tco_0845373 [Tanacetum coccineum]